MTLHPKQALPILLLSAAISSGIVLPTRSPYTKAIAQEAVSQEALAQITNIRFQPSESGLDLILETSNGDNIRAFSSVDGNILILDLVGVRLDIGSESFQADNPTDAVSSLVVETADEQTVRITLAGTETLPEANLATTGAEFIVSLPGVTSAEIPQPEDPSQVATNIAEITNIRLQPISSGVELILETSNGDLIQPFSTVEGQTLILDLTNARLALTDRDRYSASNPIEEASLLTVETLDSQSVRLTIVGVDTVPEANLSVTGEEFIVDIPSPAAIARSQDSLETSDSGTLRIGVTGQEEDYAVDDATTATRTDTPLRDIPQSIQVIPRQVLEDQQAINLNDAVRNVSGAVLTEADPRGLRFTLRGFESSSVLRDGFPQTFGSTGNIGFPDLSAIERLEVLKGPASILFGVVEPGGVVNLVTEKPLTEQRTEIELLGGNNGLFSSAFDITGPFSADERSLYRVNALYRREDYFRDYTTPIQRYFFAPTASFQPNDNTDIRVFLEYLDEERPADFGIVAIGDRVADIPFTRALGERSDRVDINSLQVGYDLEHRLSDNWKVRNAFSYRRFDTVLDYANPLLGGGAIPDETTGNYFRNFLILDQPSDTYIAQANLVGEFNTGDIEHTLLFGVDFYRREESSLGLADFTQVNFINIFNPVYGLFTRPSRENLTTITNGSSETTNWGFYVQDQIALTDDFKVLIGGRYDTATIRTINEQTLFFTASDTTVTESAFSPRLGIVYQPIDELSLYASYSQSFRPNSGTTTAGDLIDPERGEQFEVGARAELLEGDLIFNLAYFNLTKQNISQSDPNNPGFFIATGEQQSDGIELDIIGEILPGWNIVANYAYINARTTEDNTITVGNKLRGVPENSANFWTTYEVQSGDLEGLSFGVGFNTASEREGDNENTFTLDGYFLTNAAIAYRKDNWRVGVNFRNIFDVDYIEGTQGRLNVQPGQGFTAIGSFEIEF